MRHTILSALVLLSMAGCASGTVGDTLAGWALTGSSPSDYRAERIHVADDTAAQLAARVADPRGSGTLAQVVEAEPYRGRRVRLSAEVEAKAVAERAGLWLRVDGTNAILAFDNMEDRPIRGTVAARRYAVVLDVPESAERLAYGVLLRGGGRVVVDNVKLEPVGAEVSTTDQLLAPLPIEQPAPAMLLQSPANLNFEE